MSNRSLFCVVTLAAISLPFFANAQTYRDAVLADSPLHYWTFDEAEGNAFDQIDPLFENELIPEGGAGRIASFMNAGGLSLGLAADFNGSNGNRFYAADLSGTQTSNSWAVEFWVRVLSSTSDSYIAEATLGGVFTVPASSTDITTMSSSFSLAAQAGLVPLGQPFSRMASGTTS